MITNNALSFIHEDGRCLIKQHFDVFRSLVTQARDLVQRGNYDLAAIYADMAATHAFIQHSGLFVSPELEQILLTIGCKAIQHRSYTSKNTSLPRTPRNVVHVVTFVRGIGGHTRLIWRWIQQDAERSHSLVLMRQATDEVPNILRNAVLNSQGKIYGLNGSFVSRAKQLSKIADADMVVLHGADQIIPTIAFANKEQSPPIITVNHGDDVFGVEFAISDVVANLRESGMRLSLERRGIEAERNVLLPIILSPIHRTLSRTEAKRQLGIADNSIVLFSIARKEKYRTIDGISVSFAEAHVPLLERYNQAVLLVIGPDNNEEDWSAAIQRTQGRVRVLGEREDTAVFYQAADIYVDSFPIPSNTSLLEAGSYSVPLVSYFPYSDACEILGADMPGLAGNLIRVQELEEYTAVLSRLIEDEKFRLSLGEATRRKIIDTHVGSNWQRSLEEVYVRATILPRVSVTSVPMDQMFLGEPDVIMPRRFSLIFDQEKTDIDKMILARTSFMPFEQRLHLWIRLLKKHDFGRMGRISLLLPLWLSVRLQKLYARLQKLVSLN